MNLTEGTAAPGADVTSAGCRRRAFEGAGTAPGENAVGTDPPTDSGVPGCKRTERKARSTEERKI